MFRMGRTPKSEQTSQEPNEVGPTTPTPQDHINAAPPTVHAPPPTPSTAALHDPGTAASERSSTTSKPVTESETLARQIKEGALSGFVGVTTVLTGEVTFKGMLRVDGHLTGTVMTEKGTLIVSSGGIVDADIAVAIAKINGTIHGDVIATERIEMGRTAHVHGNIETPTLMIEPGAIFEGHCHMRQPQQEAARAVVAKQSPLPAAARSSDPKGHNAPAPEQANAGPGTTPRESNGQAKQGAPTPKTTAPDLVTPVASVSVPDVSNRAN